jgi:hypothetical protein
MPQPQSGLGAVGEWNGFQRSIHGIMLAASADFVNANDRRLPHE